MQETTNLAKPTPTRRRQGRGAGGKATGQKMYASENDVASVSNLAHEQNSHPHTPQKSYSGSPEPQSGTGNQTGSKQRSRNKPRTRNTNPNTVASPEVTRQNRHSTPQNIPVNAKPTAAAAFAGATFHASPAPSALPMPSFYSKSIPESPGPRQDAQQQTSPPPTGRERPTPQHPATAPRARESPLDAIFRADRAEREKARRSSSLQSSAQPDGSESPGVPSPRDSHNSPFVPKPFNTHPGHRMPIQRSSSGISTAELDGYSGKSLGPAFSTPYQDRIRAARGTHSQSPNGPRDLQTLPVEDRSEALKKYLFGAKGPAPSPQPSAPGPPAQYVHNGFMGNNPEPQGGHSADLRAMEDNLRRILKLESPMATANSGDRPLYS